MIENSLFSRIGISTLISVFGFIVLLGLNILQAEIYSIFILLSSIILIFDILSIINKERWGGDPFLYLDIFLYFTVVCSPIMHFYTDSWLVYLKVVPADWTFVANKLSIIYFVCILIFFMTRNIFGERYKFKKINQNYLFIADSKKLKYIYFLMIVSFLLQFYVYVSFGGILGYIKNYGEEGFAGYGSLFLISELFPLIFILVYFIKALEYDSFRKWSVIMLFLLLLFISCLYFGGLRGSRSNTLWTLLHAILLIHFSIRKFKVKQILLIALFGFSFLYIGKIYKMSRGALILESNYSTTQDIAPTDIVGGDMSRYSMQAYLIYMFDYNSNFTPALGLTYLGDALKFIPPMKETSKRIDKVQAGSRLMYGEAAIISNVKSSRVYGLLGESILNFGILLSPIIFIVFGIFITWLKHLIEDTPPTDLKFFLVPLFLNLGIVILNSDLDNNIFFFIKRIIPMTLIILFIRKKMPSKKM